MQFVCVHSCSAKNINFLATWEKPHKSTFRTSPAVFFGFNAIIYCIVVSRGPLLPEEAGEGELDLQDLMKNEPSSSVQRTGSDEDGEEMLGPYTKDVDYLDDGQGPFAWWCGWEAQAYLLGGQLNQPPNPEVGLDNINNSDPWMDW